jgi:hypothetical protein
MADGVSPGWAAAGASTVAAKTTASTNLRTMRLGIRGRRADLLPE